MTYHRGIPVWLIPVSCLVATAAVAQESPEKALKYHQALLKRPHNAALFDRFFAAWIDEQPVETLAAFLTARAQADGGQNWTVLATYHLRRGNEEEALAVLGKGIDALPDDPALAMERAKLRLRRLEFDAARADFAKVVAGKDEALALEAAKLTGKSWLREGRTEEAVKAWDAVLAAHPGDEDLLEDLVETAAAESETEQALVYADKLVAASRDPYQKTLRMLRRGDLLAQAGRNDEAVEAYAATLKQVGDGSWLEREVLAQIEKVFRKQDRLDDLSAQLKKLVEAYPQRLLIHRQLARLEAAQGETDAAIGRFREVLKRSPGERELREEFVRLLTDGERFDDAAAELAKLIELAPADVNLHLQVAALRARQNQPDAVLAALKKAHELLGKDEGNGIRIAGLMLQYGLKEPGEALLKELAATAGAGPAALEALAAQYGRIGRKAEAIELLKKAGAGDEVDVLLRTCGAISALGESAVAFETLSARGDQFSSDPRFLAALAQSALAAGKAADAVPQVLKLVRLAKQTTELAESVNLASRVIAGAEKAPDVLAALASQPTRTAAETCLLASLTEDSGDFIAVGKLLEPDPDPLVIHFHAALLDRRGEFDAAIAVLSRLADTEEGRKAAYFKDLSELQQRAGKTTEALATVERWKLAAPGDKSAWITGSRLLRESGKPEDAVKMTRQAVGRFEGDADLAASLASLHDEAGQWPDAEAIYWKLYDESQSPTDQARWAAQLAQLATRTGKTNELEEKLRERARGNRKSLGPILAMAELARVTNNEDKRRDLLLEAVRLQPKDLDLRLQIAALEEISGNGERVIAVLEEALPYDVNGRVRSSLAQAYLRQGQPVKGMRELRLLSGKAGFDPRSAESAAAALAGTKLYDEAISLLRSELPDGGDWRSRYLLALLLEEDGRETEALPIFLGLIQAEGEIPSVVAKVAPARSVVGQSPAEVRAMQQWIMANQLAYQHRRDVARYGMSGYGGPSATLTGPFFLPNTAADVRQFALIHLCGLSKKKSGEVDESVRAQIKAAGIENAAFLCDLAATNQGGDGSNLAKLLETYPDEPGLFEWIMWNGGMYGNEKIDDKLIRRVLGNAGKLSPLSQFSAWVSLAMTAPPEDPAWPSMLAAAKSVIDGNSSDGSTTVAYRLMYMLQGKQQGSCPEIHRPAVKMLLLDSLARMAKEHPENTHNGFSLAMVALAGTPEAWLDELNAVVRSSRKKTGQMPPGYGYSRTRFSQMLRYASRSMSGRHNPWGSMGDLFAVPTIETMPTRSIPQEVLSQLAGADQGRGQNKPPLAAGDLVKRGAKVESPFLRAWLAAKVGDQAALTAALAATAPAEEASDFEILRAITAIQDKKPANAFAALLKARAAAGSDREYSGWINTALLAVAGTMTPEERAGIADDLQATFMQLRQVFGTQGAPVLAVQATKLGLDELAKRIAPAGPAAGKGGTAATGPAAMASPAVSRGSSSSSGGSPDKIRKFVSEKKYEAAAREVLQGIRSQSANRSAYYFNNQLPDLLSMLGKEGQAELLKLVDPGESKSLVKRLEFVDICNAIGKPERALATLEALAKERPDDGGIAARLVFAIPAGQTDRRIALMNQACKGDDFFLQASTVAARLEDLDDNKASMDFFETATRWLESADPKVTAAANLTWISYYSKEFFSGDFTSGLPSLFSTGQEAGGDKALIERRNALCGRLARAMMRHAACAEEGFRLLAAGKVWTIEPAEMDANARNALLAVASPGAVDPSRRYSSNSFFSLISGNGGSSSGGDLSESSSAAWLIRRMTEAKSPGEIFTPEFIAALKERNPEVGGFMATLVGDLKGDDLAALWRSDVMKSQESRLMGMLRPLVLKRVATTPDAAKFFVGQISAITPGTAANQNGNGDSGNTPMLFVAAINSAASGKPGDLDAVAKAISRAVFGEKLDFTNPKNDSRDYQRVSFMESLGVQVGDDPGVMVRVQPAFFRLGVPMDDESAIQPFENKRFTKVEEAEAFLESLGWLADADRWEPYACITYNRNSAGNGVSITLEPKLLLERAMQYMSYRGLEVGSLVKKLKDRKTGRFGSLMMAAALSRGDERAALAGQAFAESAAVLAKLPPERIDSLSLVLPWLTADARAKLPDAFRRKAQAAEAKIREEVVRKADQFLEAMKTGYSENSLSNAGEVVLSLIPYDLDKAVDVFVTADRHYTDSLARGGRFSYSSSDDWQFSQRDYAFGQIMQNASEDPFAANPSLKLKFLARILASPSGKRLVFNDSSYTDRSVFPQAVAGLIKDSGKDPFKEPGGFSGKNHVILKLVTAFQAVEPALKPVALPCFVLARLDSNSISDVKERQALLPQLEKLVAKDPQAGLLATARLALGSWKFCTPEEKVQARAAFTTLISDEAVPDVERMAMAAEFLAQVPKNELLDAPFSAALAKLYQDYCGGERSAVSLVSAWLFDALVKSPFRDESVVALHASLARSFWENAKVSKPAGHPPIPASLARSVFITGVLGKDNASISKVFPRIKDALAGKLSSMVFLMQFDQHELAKQLAPLPAEPFQVESMDDFRYDRAMETSLAAFKQAGPDALTLQKLEIEMLRFPVGTGDAAPAEAQDARLVRLIDATAASPPQGVQFPLTLQLLLAKSPGNPKLLPMLDAWAKAHPVTGFLRDPNGSQSEIVERSRSAAIKLHGMAAMHAFAAGDFTRLDALRDVAATVAGTRNNRGYYVAQDFTYMAREMPRAVMADVAAGRTAGYKTGLQAWNDFTVDYANVIARHNTSAIDSVLAISRFLAWWAGDAPAFAAMVSRLPKQAEGYVKQFPVNEVFNSLLGQSYDDGSGVVAPSLANRREFLAAVLVQPGFAASYGRNIGWLGKVQNNSYEKAVEAIALDPPKDTVREALPELYEYAGQMKRANDPDGAIAEFRKALDSCPPGDEWKSSRGMLKCKMAEVMLAKGDKDKARETYLTIAADEVAPSVKGRYTYLANKLDVKKEN